LLLTGSDTDRVLSRGALTSERLAVIARRRGGQHETREHAVRRTATGVARRLALAIRGMVRQLADNKRQLAGLVVDLAPRLLAKHGVGPVSAAQAIVSWSHPGRCRNDAAYAALAGASPVPASSGRIVRHRLNRGGDRHLNRALHDILLTRWRSCQRTHAYITRRRAEGKTDPEIRRCLKRYIARELYRCLNTTMAT
jgi:transposase